MQGILLILESCNNVIIVQWVKSLAELQVLKKKKASSKQYRIADDQIFHADQLSKKAAASHFRSTNAAQKFAPEAIYTVYRANQISSSFTFALCINDFTLFYFDHSAESSDVRIFSTILSVSQ